MARESEITTGKALLTKFFGFQAFVVIPWWASCGELGNWPLSLPVPLLLHRHRDPECKTKRGIERTLLLGFILLHFVPFKFLFILFIYLFIYFNWSPRVELLVFMPWIAVSSRKSRDLWQKMWYVIWMGHITFLPSSLPSSVLLFLPPFLPSFSPSFLFPLWVSE